MLKDIKIPDVTIERVALYLRPLENLEKSGVQVISSDKLAELCNVNPAQVRKDLSFFGEFGVRGVGYQVSELLGEIKKILASDREWRLGIAGLDDMGMALIQHKNFLNRGYKFIAAFDSNPNNIGKHLPNGLVVQPLSKLVGTSLELSLEIGVVTTTPSEAQKTADLFIEAGILAVLNFTTTHLRKPDCCLIQNVDFTFSLDNLAYRLNKSL
ncbi:redox-sensing transcriptional repressor Rex [Thermodesulfobacteriota bacterium]